MAHDGCIQEDAIEEIHDTLKRLLVVLERIAEQGAFIQALQKDAARHDKSFENLFNRVNALEIKTEGEKVKVGFIMAGISAATATFTTLVLKFWKS